MALKLISLNVESDKHLDLILPFLEKERPDVICLQEVYQADLRLFEEAFGMQSVFTQLSNMTVVPNKWDMPAKGPWGIAILSTYPILQSSEAYYLQEETKDHQFEHPNEIARAVRIASLQVREENYTIVTTHFTWAPDRNPIPLQMQSLDALLPILDSVGEFVLCGDFNAPRGEVIFDTLASRYADNIPHDVVTTIDPEIHRTKGSVKLVIDVLFSTSDYQASDVHVVCGVSDHCAIVGSITKKE
jgi:endonuclease/exonuclease/phosphatase family metal-dependent hydrolase